MKLGKVLIAGLVVTVFDAVIGMMCCGKLFSWVYSLQPVNVWKPMAHPGAIFFLGSAILNMLFAFVYALLRKGIPGKNKVIKGLVYGLCVWMVGVLPGMFATYSFMTVATTVVMYWTILGLVQLPLEGAIVASIYEK